MMNINKIGISRSFLFKLLCSCLIDIFLNSCTDQTEVAMTMTEAGSSVDTKYAPAGMLSESLEVVVSVVFCMHNGWQGFDVTLVEGFAEPVAQ